MAKRPGDATIQSGSTSNGKETQLDGLSIVRCSLLNRGLSKGSTDMILASWRDSTKKQYICYIHRWILFSSENNYDIFSTDVTHVLAFLSALYNEGLAYSALNTARSAMATFLGVTAN